MNGPRPSPLPRNPGLWLSRAGEWFHDDLPVRHVRLSNLLTRSIARDENGGLIVTTGRDRLPFRAEDAPLVVRTIEFEDNHFRIQLSNGLEETLETNSYLCMDGVGRIRSVVGHNSFWALWSRSATQALIGRVDDSGTHILLPQGIVPLRHAHPEQDWSLRPLETSPSGTTTR